MFNVFQKKFLISYVLNNESPNPEDALSLKSLDFVETLLSKVKSGENWITIYFDGMRSIIWGTEKTDWYLIEVSGGDSGLFRRANHSDVLLLLKDYERLMRKPHEFGFIEPPDGEYRNAFTRHLD